MPAPVNPQRTVRGEQARTRLARRAVVTAARTSFVEKGYAGTTIEAISRRADVPVATIYRLYGSKLGILKALVDTAIAGDDRAVAVRERPDVAAMLEEADPSELVRRAAGVTAAINRRANDVFRVLAGAAESDEAAGALLADLRRQRDRGQAQIVRALARRSALRADLRERDATDLVHALMAPEVYGLLVVDRGWSPERYERWLAATVAHQLLEAR